MAAHQIGLIGGGWIAPFHIEALKQLGRQNEIVWVADPNLDRARALAGPVGAHALSDYRDGLRDVDCVFVLCPIICMSESRSIV